MNKIDRRLNLVSWLDEFITSEVTDPALYANWEREGFTPNMSDEDMLRMVSDEDKFIDIVDTFASILDIRQIAKEVNGNAE